MNCVKIKTIFSNYLEFLKFSGKFICFPDKKVITFYPICLVFEVDKILN